ncbi:MAG: carboxypeptidase regulatory-like domain-containing protein [Acidobacteriota bacterium]
MTKRFTDRLCMLLVVVSLLAPTVPAQVTTTGRLTGTVADIQGALIPKAQVVAVHDQTKTEYKVTANSEGGWSVPAVPNGTYTVTITATGFKSTVVQNVKVDAGTAATVNASLEVGGATEQVIVTSGASVIQTESATISTTIVGRQIGELPYTTREAMQLVLTLPGVQTPGTPRTSSINGLPKASLNITLDGANVQDNFLKSSDGFFTSTQVRTDAIEEVTVSTATPGSESAGGGATQIKFVTKSGSNDYRGGLFWQHRNDALNSNYYFNNINGLPREKVRLHQYGGNIGGPIRIPKLFNGRDKAFFFVNFEEFRLPQSFSVGRTVLTDDARRGIFTYKDSAGAIRKIDLYAIAATGAGTGAAKRTYPSTPDPQIATGLGLIAAAQGNGLLSSRIETAADYNRLDLNFQDPARNLRRFPTVRFDFNITQNHHLEFVHNYQHYFSVPDGVNSIFSIYPGLGTHVGSPEPTAGSIYRNSFTFAMAERWTINDRLVNEVRATSSGNGTSMFRRELAPGNFALFDGRSVGNPFSSGFFTYSSQSRRNTPVKSLTDNLNWMRGTHNLNFGMGFTRIASFFQEVGSAYVPTVTLGIAASDPINTGATSIFTTGNFPGSTSGQRGDAQNLYALLTGRMSAVGRTAVLNEATRDFTFTPTTERNHQIDLGFYAQDSWKVRPNLTLNYGLRWEIQPSPVNDNEVYTRVGPEGVYGVSGLANLFKPGVFEGKNTEFRLLEKGEQGFNTSKKDFAPTLGFAWQPNLGKGFLRRIFGEADQTVIRGGAAISFVREGFNAYNSMFGSNEGPSVALGTTPGNDPTIFGTPGSRLLRDGVLPLRPFPEAKFPLTARQGASINDFEPNLRPGYVSSWTFGIQRELTKNMALEIRYVGNHGTHLWRQYEINEVNIFENGFLDEFKIAAENLRIARAASPTSNNFGNQNLPGQKDIPIIRTALGLTSDLTFATTISRGEAGRLAANIAQNLTRMNNLINAKLVPSISLADPNNPGQTITLSNFFVANPRSPTGSFIMTSSADSTYNALQVELRRRLSSGLLVQGSYVWSKSLTNFYGSDSGAFNQVTTFRNLGFDKSPAPRDARHGFKVDWLYELPIGPGRAFLNGNMPVVRKLLEGWQTSGVLRLQSGTPTQLLGGRLTFSNREAGVVLHNITFNELQKLVKMRKETVCDSTGACRGLVFWLPPALIANSQAAFEGGGKTLANLKVHEPFIGPPTTPGELGQRLFLYGPWTSRWDLNIMKRTYITERTNFEIRVQFLNAFNQSTITIRDPDTNASSFTVGTATFGQTVNAYRDFSVSGTNDPGGRLIEFQLRLNF